VIGSALMLALGVLAIGSGRVMLGIALATVGPVIVVTFAYSLYDELDKKTQRRQNDISRQFPNVVSKLALLVTSGMNMERAWKETAAGQELELYKEMRKTAEELDNLVSPELAYTNFISRCNTKETAKLASAILQSLSKGNAEIGRLLKVMAREAWLERRHMAKRDSEKANAKLMIPMMLLFLAILMMILVPVAMNFTVL
jgi:tight adherence protein C